MRSRLIILSGGLQRCLITSAKEVCRCLSVCLSIYNTWKKLLIGFSWKFYHGRICGQGKWITFWKSSTASGSGSSHFLQWFLSFLFWRLYVRLSWFRSVRTHTIFCHITMSIELLSCLTELGNHAGWTDYTVFTDWVS